MLFDSDINVYEDSNVAVPEAAEFNIRGRIVKALTDQQKKEQTKKRNEQMLKQKVLAEQKAKLLIEAMPETMRKGFSNAFKQKLEMNEEIFIRPNQEEIEVILEENLLGEDGQELPNFEEYERKRKAENARKKALLQAQVTQAEMQL